jgi:hypothetical protein
VQIGPGTLWLAEVQTLGDLFDRWLTPPALPTARSVFIFLPMPFYFCLGVASPGA